MTKTNKTTTTKKTTHKKSSHCYSQTLWRSQPKNQLCFTSTQHLLNSYTTAAGNTLLSSIQFSSVPWLIGSSEGHERIQQRYPLPVFSAGGPCEKFPAWAGMSTLWYRPSSISSVDQGVAHPPRCPWRMVLERLSWHVTCLSHTSVQQDWKWRFSFHQQLCGIMSWCWGFWLLASRFMGINGIHISLRYSSSVKIT